MTVSSAGTGGGAVETGTRAHVQLHGRVRGTEFELWSVLTPETVSSVIGRTEGCPWGTGDACASPLVQDLGPAVPSAHPT